MAVPVPVPLLAERRLTAVFLEAGAVSMADAIPFVPDNLASRRAFARLKGRDVLRTDGQGKWWLDEERWDRRTADRLTRAGLAMLAVGLAAAVAALR